MTSSDLFYSDKDLHTRVQKRLELSRDIVKLELEINELSTILNSAKAKLALIKEQAEKTLNF